MPFIRLGLLAGLIPAGVSAQAAKECLYVANSQSGDISVVEVPRHKVVGVIPASVVGEHPDDIIANRGGSLLFVSRLDAGDVVAIDAETERVAWRVDVGGVPNHLTLSADERYLYVPLFDQGRLAVVDTRTHEIVARPDVGLGAHGTQLAPDGKSVYVGSIGANQLAVVDASSQSVSRVIPLGEGVRPFQIAPDGRRAFVQLSKLHGFVVLDLARDSVIATVNLPTLGRPLPEPTAGGSLFVMNHGIGLSPDGRWLVANGSLSGFVAIYRFPSLELFGTVPVGRQPNWVVFSRDSRFAYVSNRADDTISVIEIGKRREAARIRVGDYPQRMTVAIVKRRAGPRS